MLLEPLVDLWKQYKSSKLDQVFPWSKANAENVEILISSLKSAKTPDKSMISISNVKKVNWTKFEQNTLENKQFEISGISGTPDSQSTFGKINFKASRVL